MRTLLIACAVMVSSLVVAAQNRTVTLVGTTPLTNSFLTMGTNGTQLRSTGIAVQNLTNLIGIGTINGVSSVFTNTVWVAKNGSDTTGALGQLGRPFLTIQAAITAASSGYTVFVMPGTYDEQITLKDGVNLWLSDGVTLTYSDSGNTPAILDNGASVTCVIDGYGKLLRTGSTGTSANNLLTTGASTIVLRCQSLEVRGGSSSESIRQTGASTLTVYAKSITASGAGWSMNNASAIGTLWNCSVVATNDYGILKSSGNLTVNNSFVRSDANSAFQCAAGTSTELLTIKNSVGYSTALFGLEMSGGYCVAIDSTFESTRNVAVEGSAISKYGGELLVLDNVQLICTEESAFSIETQNITPHGEIQIRGQSYANRVIDPNPEINITIGSLIVQTNMHRTISDVAATGSATAFNLKSLNTLGTGDTLLSITNNATLAFRVDGASGYTGAGTKFLSDDGTYQTAGGGDSVWTNYIGRIMPIEGNTNNVLTFTSGLADNATNIAVQINSTNIWSHGTRLLSTGTGGTEYFYLTTDGGMHVGNDLFAPQPGQTIISERDTALGAADHNGIGLLMYTNGVLTAEWDSVGSSSAWSVSQKGGLGIGTGTHLESHTEADNAYFKLNYVASEVFDFDPFVSSSGSAVAYYMRSVNALTNGDSLFLLENTSGVEAFRVAGNSGYTGTGANFLSDDGTYKTAGGGDSVWTNYLGRIMPIDGNTNNVLTFTSGAADNATNVALIVNTTNSWEASFAPLAKFSSAGNDRFSFLSVGSFVVTGDPNSQVYLSSPDAQSSIDLTTQDVVSYIDITVGGDSRMHLEPSIGSSGSAVAYLFDTSNYLNTSGDLLAAYRNAGTNRNVILPDGTVVIGDNAAIEASRAVVSSRLDTDGYSENGFKSQYTESGVVYEFSALQESGQSEIRTSANGDNKAVLASYDGGVGAYLELEVGNMDRTVFYPGIPSSGTAVAYLFDTSNVLTNGDTFMSIRNAGTELLGFKPGEAGNPSAQIVWGPGTTNVLYRSGANLVYTNGQTSTSMQIVNGSGTSISVGVGLGNVPNIQASGSNPIYLSPSNGSTVYQVGPNDITPTALGKDLGQNGTSGGWRDLHLRRYVTWNGTTNSVSDAAGDGSPEGSLVRDPGSLYRDWVGGKLYFKVTGTGNTGWQLIGGGNMASQYDQLVHPHRADQVGAVINTSDPSSVNYGHALFSGTAATNANFIEYRWQVPKNINTSVDLEASWSVMLNAADTDASTYTIGMASVAASSSYSAPTLGNYVTLTIAADASGAQNDYETVQDVTLTGWAAALTAGQVFVIRVARDGAGDTSNVAHYDAGLTIKYGVQ